MSAEAPQQPSSAVCVDLVSQLQFELHRMSELFLSTVGELQRDAGPVSINSEDLLNAPTSSYDAETRSKGFASEVMQVFNNMQQLISKLPSAPGSEEHYDRIRALQMSNQELLEKLSLQQGIAESKLEDVGDMYALLAQHELARSLEQ